MTYYNSWYFYCPRISLIPCCTRANWQQGAYTHDLLLYTFLSTCAPRARSCLYTHTLSYTAQFTVRTLRQRTIRLDASCRVLQREFTVKRRLREICITSCVRRMYDAIYIHRQQLWVVYVRARHEQKQNARLTRCDDGHDGYASSSSSASASTSASTSSCKRGAFRVGGWNENSATIAPVLQHSFRVSCMYTMYMQTNRYAYTHTHTHT